METLKLIIIIIIAIPLCMIVGGISLYIFLGLWKLLIIDPIRDYFKS